jgi:hypothetical protein
VLFYLSDK